MNEPYLDDPYVQALPESRPFWAAAAEGRLLGKRCTKCSQHHWYPRAICPFCGSDQTEWVALSGRGRIHAFSTLRRAEPPYTVAYVELEEGPKMLTNLVDMAEADMQIGRAVRVVFRRTPQGRDAPKFTADDAPAGAAIA